ncbi:MAG TPA: hypothetical protein DEO26_01185 [Candidatus Veblenbacteria bacterium]|nr:hypothetical protein [Candidatus Veblenbacteria bacterium]
MATIATTLYKNLNTKQRAELINLADPLGINDITELKEFGVSRKDNISKFVFTNLDLNSISKNPSLWSSFRDVVDQVYKYSANISRHSEVQVWARDLNNPAPVNVAFVVKDARDTNVLSSLSNILSNEIYNNNIKLNKPDSFFWIAYDTESNKWALAEY